jgi:hypothetical protein
MEGNGKGESLLDAKLAVRLMFLPNLQRLHLLRITDLGHDWSDAEKDRLSSLRGTSMVSALRFIEDCRMTFSNVMDFLKLSKTLTELEFPMHPDTSLSTLKQHLWLHRETLQTLVLGTITIAVSRPFRQFVPSSFQGTGARNGAERNPRFARCEHSSKAVFAVRFVLLFVPGFAEHPYATFMLYSAPILPPIGHVASNVSIP